MLTHLPETGLETSQLMQRVRNSVIEQTDGDQVPWESSSLRRPLIFNLDITVNPPASEGLSAAEARQHTESLFWESIKDSADIASFQAYVDRFGEKGLFAPLALRRIERLGASDPETIESRLDFDLRPVQRTLLALGYDVGVPDGLIGPQTRRAITAW